MRTSIEATQFSALDLAQAYLQNIPTNRWPTAVILTSTGDVTMLKQISEEIDNTMIKSCVTSSCRTRRLPHRTNEMIMAELKLNYICIACNTGST